MSEPITIGPESFQPARQTFAALLDLAPLEQEVGDLRDEVLGLQTRLEHAEQQIFALGDADGEYDTNRLDEIKAHRKDLRAKSMAASVAYFRARVALTAVRLTPKPAVDYLLEHLDDTELERVLEQLNDRPTRPPSATESEES